MRTFWLTNMATNSWAKKRVDHYTVDEFGRIFTVYLNGAVEKSSWGEDAAKEYLDNGAIIEHDLPERHAYKPRNNRRAST